MELDEYVLIDQVLGVAEEKVNIEISHARFKGLINLDFIIQSLHCCCEMLAHLINLILIGDKKNHYLYTTLKSYLKMATFPSWQNDK
ncbi:hypothetical protein [Pseudoalteromonas tetraodonis]|uniref:hypothetical protein n=1 Tax=Pseudoalteromonas tetraodonis TaxID=43659 RepID=UPI002595E431|nr:hypothetical protein [uncultured Pseudoalteromonas sp.]